MAVGEGAVTELDTSGVRKSTLSLFAFARIISTIKFTSKSVIQHNNKNTHSPPYIIKVPL